MAKKVYLSIGADFIHGGHIEIINKASQLGELTVGVLTDEVIISYQGYPILPFQERCNILENINGVRRVIAKDSIDYKKILEVEKPDIIVHGSVWRGGSKEDLLELLKNYPCELVEFPYTIKKEFEVFEHSLEKMRHTPDIRRRMLRSMLAAYKRPIRVLEAHSGLTGLVVEKTSIMVNQTRRSFDAMWVSSLCDSTSKGKPDIELVDMTSRLGTINEIMEVTTKPIILDGDTGGLKEHFEYNVKTLERLGVSAIIIEDKVGLKKNSLFGTEVFQEQADIKEFCEKIAMGKQAQRTNNFMIIARIESLILEQGMEDAINRAIQYVGAGADGIMIHSKSKSGEEVIQFCRLFREIYSSVPIVAVPTTYNSMTENELAAAGVNIIIYANQLIRSAFPAMMKTAESILRNERALESDSICMPIKEILNLL